jgi:predicted nucleic acid-binding protein
VIILDTNVLSEGMRANPDPAVMGWLGALSPLEFWITTITVAEIRFGLACLPDGRQRDDLGNRFEALQRRSFPDRILSFDLPAAERYGRLMAQRRALGRPMSPLDGQIAAIASIHHAALATRNTDDFEACGLSLINPWSTAEEKRT